MLSSDSRILVTGAAGFIGSHFVELVSRTTDARIVGLDNFNDYYNPALKRQNAAELRSLRGFSMVEGDFCDAIFVDALFERYRFTHVVHLGASAGVGFSVVNPEIYFHTNVDGTLTLLEAVRRRPVARFVFASSSTVYGVGAEIPFREDGAMGIPASPYGASKRAAELLGLTYYHLHGVPFVCVRPFSVYGPRLRPELALALFTRRILAGEPITIYGDGSSRRDFTHVSDVCAGLRTALTSIEALGRCINLGNSEPVTMVRLIELLQEASGVKARIIFERQRPEDLPVTFADLTIAKALLNYRPTVKFPTGVKEYLAWFRRYGSAA
jgi:UDP-glucuronate 4-epimerase